MGSIVCVRCGAPLIPHSHCNACHDVLCFKCSSCSMITDERIHAYCLSAGIVNGIDNVSQDIQKLSVRPTSSKIITSNNYISKCCHLQNQFNEELKYSSIKLSTSYWFNIFQSITSINRYWFSVFNISNPNTSIV